MVFCAECDSTMTDQEDATEGSDSENGEEAESPSITTIQVTEDQREQLADMKEGNETYRSLISRVIDVYNDEYNSGDIDETRAREIARDEINSLVTTEALE